MSLTIAQNEPTAGLRTFYFECRGLDGISRLPGLTITPTTDLKFSKIYGAEANAAGTVTPIADGFYAYTATTTEVNTKGAITLRTNRSDIYPDFREHQVV